MGSAKLSVLALRWNVWLTLVVFGECGVQDRGLYVRELVAYSRTVFYEAKELSGIGTRYAG